MKNLEDIKHDYLIFRKKPTEEEIKFYNISKESYTHWRTEHAIECKNELDEAIEMVIINADNKKVGCSRLMNIVSNRFFLATNDNVFEDYYYQEIPKIYKKMYENNMFDYLSYREYTPAERERIGVIHLFANQDFSELQPRALVYENQKYAGEIPLLYYSGHLDVFEDILKYYANYIYQKYGLYIQESMNVLIKFCKEYNLPYVDMLEDAKKRAKELDYPTHHEYKYQFVYREDVEWE